MSQNIINLLHVSFIACIIACHLLHVIYCMYHLLFVSLHHQTKYLTNSK